MGFMDKKVIINIYGERCTPVVTRVTKQLQSMNKGEVLIVNCDNMCSLKKIRSYCSERGYTLDVGRIDKDAMRYIIKVI